MVTTTTPTVCKKIDTSRKRNTLPHKLTTNTSTPIHPVAGETAERGGCEVIA